MIVLKSFVKIIKIEEDCVEVETFNTKLQKTIRLPKILFDDVDLIINRFLIYQVKQRENKTLYHEIIESKK